MQSREAITILEELELIESRISRCMADLKSHDIATAMAMPEGTRTSGSGESWAEQERRGRRIENVGFHGATSGTLSGLDNEHRKLLMELRVDTYSWHLRAHRLAFLLKKLPGLSQFRCAATRDVRNHLMEHPEGASSRIDDPTFGYDWIAGPQVKGLRQSKNAGRHADPGLYACSRELRENLLRELARSGRNDMR